MSKVERSTILVVEDEPAIAESVAYSLRREGFAPVIAASLEAARAHTAVSHLIVLDLMLPDGSGFELLSELRAQENAVPIIVLSSRDGEADRVAALETGADDYVTKPFSPREVVARVRAVLRRVENNPSTRAPAVTIALSVAPDSRRAFYLTHELELTRVEFNLLEQLLQTPGRVLGRAELIDRVWGNGFAITDRTIDSHIKSLRRKVSDVGGSPKLIQTVRGVGYRVSESGSAAVPQ